MSATTPTPVATAPEQARMTCAEATLRSMVDLGAEALFNIPGRGIYPLLAELPKFPELAYVTGLHEFPLAAMADGYARGAGRPAFVNLYMSTGVLNAASAIFLAQRDRVPMVVTATQAESWAVGADHRAEVSDIVEAVRPYTKWAWMPPTPDRVPEALRRAHAIATTPPMGPTFVAIPVDYWGAEIDYTEPPATEWCQPEVAPDAASIERLASLLLDADHPCVVVGYEALAAGAGPAARSIADHLGCAIVAEPEPPMLPAPTLAPNFGGSVAEASAVIQSSDLVLHVGVNTYEAFHAQIFAAGVRKQHVWIGSSSLELNKVVPVSLALEGAIRPLVEALGRKLGERVVPGQRAALAAMVAAQVADERAPLNAARDQGWDEVPMSVARVAAELRAALPSDTVLVDHSTTAVRLVRENFPVPQGEQYLSASGSCQGWGLGAAVGVQLANPGRQVVGIVGDGGFMFGLQAVWSAAQHEIPLLAVVLNNGGWSSMRSSLARSAQPVLDAGMDLHFGWSTDYARLAETLGADGVVAETPGDLRELLAERLPLERPLVIDARVRRERKTSLSPFVGY